MRNSYFCWYESIEIPFIDDFVFYSMINYYKYLKCPKCKESGLYCAVHRNEVEQMLEKEQVNS
ncbi:MAG: hypothetical protein K5790_01660 [Nitrosopumilus sp.]|uniref:hypothetical protein n=1 Tax=Nitrosopumilus sp. TaxID=2024843 RepID=UPI00247E17AD|nr:hypothetical protein [Nitrosopumilus sp.]MCV0391980.1 hypothetical protein [Nitrosopumilus sp.]